MPPTREQSTLDPNTPYTWVGKSDDQTPIFSRHSYVEPTKPETLIGDDGFDPRWAVMPQDPSTRSSADPEGWNRSFLGSKNQKFNPQFSFDFVPSDQLDPRTSSTAARYTGPPSPEQIIMQLRAQSPPPVHTQPVLSDGAIFQPPPELEPSFIWECAKMAHMVASEMSKAVPDAFKFAIDIIGKTAMWTYHNGSASARWLYERSPEVRNPTMRRVRNFRFNPMGRRPQKKPESMFSLPPYMVGATPNVVRRARGVKEMSPNLPSPSSEDKRNWDLFHATPMPGRVRRPGQLKSTPTGRGNITPGTFEFRTPQRPKMMPTKEKFALEVQKDQFGEWVHLINKLNIKLADLKPLLQEGEFPTAKILSLYRKSVIYQDSDAAKIFAALAKCYSHPGFMQKAGLRIPIPQIPEPKEFEDVTSTSMRMSSVFQQADGCCVYCRGYPWAGKIEIRQVSSGEPPSYSHDKSVKPYTPEEQAEIDQNKFDSIHRRWCQESRWDWLFEDPDLTQRDEKGKFTWIIPRNDARLRHISTIFQEHQTHSQRKLYPADANDTMQKLRVELSRQDIAAKILIEAITKENPALTKRYLAMDLERKRNQVETKYLCVRQVRIVKPALAVDALGARPGGTKRKDHVNEHGRSVKKVKFSEAPEEDPVPRSTVRKSRRDVRGVLKQTSGNNRPLYRYRDPTVPLHGPGSEAWHAEKHKEREQLLAAMVNGKTAEEHREFMLSLSPGSTGGSKAFVFSSGSTYVYMTLARYKPKPYEIDPALDDHENCAARAAHDEEQALLILDRIHADFNKEERFREEEREEDRRQAAEQWEREAPERNRLAGLAAERKAQETPCRFTFLERLTAAQLQRHTEENTKANSSSPNKRSRNEMNGEANDDNDDNDVQEWREPRDDGRPKKRVRWDPTVITPERRRREVKELQENVAQMEQEWREKIQCEQPLRALVGKLFYLRKPRLYVTPESEKLLRAEVPELMAKWLHARKHYGIDSEMGKRCLFYYWALVEEKCAMLDNMTPTDEETFWAQAQVHLEKLG